MKRSNIACIVGLLITCFAFTWLSDASACGKGGLLGRLAARRTARSGGGGCDSGGGDESQSCGQNQMIDQSGQPYRYVAPSYQYGAPSYQYGAPSYQYVAPRTTAPVVDPNIRVQVQPQSQPQPQPQPVDDNAVLLANAEKLMQEINLDIRTDSSKLASTTKACCLVKGVCQCNGNCLCAPGQCPSDCQIDMSTRYLKIATDNLIINQRAVNTLVAAINGNSNQPHIDALLAAIDMDRLSEHTNRLVTATINETNLASAMASK